MKKEALEGLTRTVLLVDPPLNNKPIVRTACYLSSANAKNIKMT